MFKQPPKPIHIPGTNKGEELVRKLGHEPGRGEDPHNYRNSRDSTGLNADDQGPVDPRMPEMPPA